MLFVRPGKLSDLDQLEAMARAVRPVLHSLPPDRRVLEARLALSQDSFRADVDAPGEEFYLFVLEDAVSGRLFGTASIVASAGYAEPFYAFRNDALIHASRELKVKRRVHALTMSHQLSGKSRLTGYYLDPAVAPELAPDPGLVARLLSRARLMFIAQHRQRFAPEIFAVLVGMSDENGVSPFWEAVGRKFFKRDFAEIELASGGRSQTFIAELMPSYPLYVPLLPPDAQRVLGEPHPNAVLPYSIHVEDGFEPDGFVDIFDAGPVLTANVAICETVRRGVQRRTMRNGQPAGGGTPYLAANALVDEFRCALAYFPNPSLTSLPAEVPLPEALADQLLLADGDTVCCVPLHHSGASR
jgi:arginine N-succinyltransferase